MTTTVPETHEKRPPTTSHTADVPGLALSPTVMRRPMVTPRSAPGPRDGVLPDDPYVLRFWVAALGPAAVTDLLRLSAAARQARAIPQPLSLPILLSEGLAIWADGDLAVLHPFPRVPKALLNRPGRRRCLLN
jgi:hypothetical protein